MDGGKWILKAGMAFAQHHLCEKRGENVAYKSWSNQSSTFPGFPSQFAVDGFYHTSSRTLLPKEQSQNSWWKLVLDHPAKIYLIITEWRRLFKEANPLVTVGLQDDTASPDFEKKFKILSNSKSVTFCDPPALARYVKLERKGEDLQLHEVGIYATDSLDDVRGVMRGYFFWSSSTVYDSFNFPPSFVFDLDNDGDQELGAYLLAPYQGTYRFALYGSVSTVLVISRHGDEVGSVMKLSLDVPASGMNSNSNPRLVSA